MSPLQLGDPEFVQIPTSGDKVHCLAFVLDATTLESLSDTPTEMMFKLKAIKKLGIQKGVCNILKRIR